MRRRWSWPLLTVALVVGGCEKNPIDRLVNPLPGGSVPLGTSGRFVIYDEELRTGGGLGLIPTAGNQDISLQDHTEPRLTANQIRYAWNGNDVGGQHLFAGFGLSKTPDLDTVLSSTGTDLSAAHYTTLKFSVRGTVSTDTTLKIEGPSDGVHPNASTPLFLDSTILDGNWHEESLSINAAALSSVRIFMTVSFQYSQPAGSTNPGGGGVVYFDDIRYEQ